MTRYRNTILTKHYECTTTTTIVTTGILQQQNGRLPVML